MDLPPLQLLRSNERTAVAYFPDFPGYRFSFPPEHYGQRGDGAEQIREKVLQACMAIHQKLVHQEEWIAKVLSTPVTVRVGDQVIVVTVFSLTRERMQWEYTYDGQQINESVRFDDSIFVSFFDDQGLTAIARQHIENDVVGRNYREERSRQIPREAIADFMCQLEPESTIPVLVEQTVAAPRWIQAARATYQRAS